MCLWNWLAAHHDVCCHHSLPSNILFQGPAEKVRLYFLLAWFHTVVQERLRYVPLGWSKIYDFNDSDMTSAFGIIDTWLNTILRGKANVNPVTIPWDALQTLVKQSVYGGRIDSDFDQRILDSFVDSLFTPKAYNVDFDLVPSLTGQQMLAAPEGTKMEHFLSWVQALPDREPPAWLSLPPTAEQLLNCCCSRQWTAGETSENENVSGRWQRTADHGRQIARLATTCVDENTLWTMFDAQQTITRKHVSLFNQQQCQVAYANERPWYDQWTYCCCYC